YHWGDIRNFSAESLNLPDKGSVLISFFYPFVSEIPCTRWGLPLRFAEYSSVLEHLRSFARQRPAGTTLLLSVHQGEWEGEIAQKISTSLGLEPKTEQ